MHVPTSRPVSVCFNLPVHHRAMTDCKWTACALCIHKGGVVIDDRIELKAVLRWSRRPISVDSTEALWNGFLALSHCSEGFTGNGVLFFQ